MDSERQCKINFAPLTLQRKTEITPPSEFASPVLWKRARRAAPQRNDCCDHQLTYSRTAPRVRRRSLGTARQGGADRGRDHRNRCAGPGRFGAVRAVRTARLNAASPGDS